MPVWIHEKIDPMIFLDKKKKIIYIQPEVCIHKGIIYSNPIDCVYHILILCNKKSHKLNSV